MGKAKHLLHCPKGSGQRVLFLWLQKSGQRIGFLHNAQECPAHQSGSLPAGSNTAGSNTAGSYTTGTYTTGAYAAGTHAAGTYAAGAYTACSYRASGYRAFDLSVPGDRAFLDGPLGYRSFTLSISGNGATGYRVAVHRAYRGLRSCRHSPRCR